MYRLLGTNFTLKKSQLNENVNFKDIFKMKYSTASNLLARRIIKKSRINFTLQNLRVTNKNKK